MTSRERVQNLTLQGKTAAEICAITGIGRPTVCRYRAEIGAGDEKMRGPVVRAGFWDEWETAVSVLLGRKKRKNEDKGDEV